MRRIRGWLTFTMALIASRGWAYTVNTPLTNGCHESMTEVALRNARAATPAAAPIPLATENDRAMAADLPFTPASDMVDLGAISLLLGVRDNDLKGLLPTDLAGLAIVQSDPTTQAEHCLRSGTDLEPTGSVTALAACRSYILGRVTAALGFLAASGVPDGSARVALTVGLTFRGSVAVPLPGFYVHMGQAMHALEDSFAHSYRAPDAGAVTAVLAWLPVANNDIDEPVSGPPHTTVLDECSSLDALRTARLARAEEAATLLLLAALGPGDSSARLANAGAVLDQYLAYTPGCTAANGWCHAPEHAYPIEPNGCSVQPGMHTNNGGASVALVLALGLAARSRRRRRAACVGAFLAVSRAQGSAEAQVSDAGTRCMATEAPSPPSPLGVYLAVGGGVDNPSANVSLGARLALGPGWLLGVDAEYNPWFSLLAQGARPGALNVYATLIHRWPPRTGVVGLRSSLHVGSSTILFDLFGVPRGTTGIYLGASVLGVEWRLSRWLLIVVDPADVAFPIPQLDAVPFGYLQYRLTVGVQWGA